MWFVFVVVLVNRVLAEGWENQRLASVTPDGSSPIRWVAPNEDAWKKTSFPSAVRMYWEYEWSKSQFDPTCSNDQIKTVVVYFWPGERVDLQCRLCELAFVFNGKMKRWGMSRDILAFMKNPQKFVSNQKRKWKDVSNVDYQEDPSVSIPNDNNDDVKIPEDYLPNSATETKTKGSNEKKMDSVYLQRNGYLSIIRASASIQAAYFCYDQESVGSTNLFYIVLAMIPPVSLGVDPALISARHDNVFTDNCGDSKMIIPHTNWQFHFLPAVRIDPPPQCREKPNAAGCAGQTFLNVTKMTGENNEPCTLDHCRVELQHRKNRQLGDLNAAVELRWNQWSKCSNYTRKQRREAHCYLIRKGGKTFPDDDSADFEWLKELNDLFDLEPFRSEGLKLYSSLIPTTVFEKTLNDRFQCNDQSSANKQRFDDIYRHIIWKAMGFDPDSDKISEKLTSPFQACLSYHKFESGRQTLVGTYMVETRNC